MAVKMRPTGSWTKRPREALLQLHTDFLIGIVEDRRERLDLFQMQRWNTARFN